MAVEENSGQYLVRLETLRGVAALWVAVGHSLIWLHFATEPAIWVKNAFEVVGIQASCARWIISVFSGAAAVDVFFVLSGFVLAQSLLKRDLTLGTWLSFAARRVFRIIPALLATLAVVLLYLTFMYPGYSVHPAASVWFNNWYMVPPTWSDVAQNIALRSSSLNSNAWTLKVEMLASLILPVLVYGVRRGGKICWATVAVVLVVSKIGYRFDVAWYSFLYMFLVGVLLQRHAEVAQRMVDRVGTWQPIALGLGLIFLASASFRLLHVLAADVIVVFAAAILIAALIRPGVRNVLFFDWRWLRFLGRISYSFYLLHFIVLFATAKAALTGIDQSLLERFPLPVMAAVAVITVIATVPLGWVFYVYIERPGIALGKRLLRSPHSGVAASV